MSSPPGRSSSLRTSTLKPSGAHQDSIPSLVVHRRHTSSADVGYVRSMRMLVDGVFGVAGSFAIQVPLLLSLWASHAKATISSAVIDSPDDQARSNAAVDPARVAATAAS